MLSLLQEGRVWREPWRDFSGTVSRSWSWASYHLCLLDLTRFLFLVWKQPQHLRKRAAPGQIKVTTRHSNNGAHLLWAVGQTAACPIMYRLQWQNSLPAVTEQLPSRTHMSSSLVPIAIPNTWLSQCTKCKFLAYKSLRELDLKVK